MILLYINSQKCQSTHKMKQYHLPVEWNLNWIPLAASAYAGQLMKGKIGPTLIACCRIFTQ